MLVADDNEVAQRLCRRVLEKAGHRVLTASDGIEAVSLALANPLDMILMDVAMPGMDGLEAMRQIKAQKPGMANPTSVVNRATWSKIPPRRNAEMTPAGTETIVAMP